MRSKAMASMMGALAAALASAPGAGSILARPSPPEPSLVGPGDHSKRVRFDRGVSPPNQGHARPRDRYPYVRKGLRP
jgi:hypothetical protein